MAGFNVVRFILANTYATIPGYRPHMLLSAPAPGPWDDPTIRHKNVDEKVHISKMRRRGVMVPET
jgi:hypothetical protein